MLKKSNFKLLISFSKVFKSQRSLPCKYIYIIDLQISLSLGLNIHYPRFESIQTDLKMLV